MEIYSHHFCYFELGVASKFSALRTCRIFNLHCHSAIHCNLRQVFDENTGVDNNDDREHESRGNYFHDSANGAVQICIKTSHLFRHWSSTSSETLHIFLRIWHKSFSYPKCQNCRMLSPISTFSLLVFYRKLRFLEISTRVKIFCLKSDSKGVTCIP